MNDTTITNTDLGTGPGTYVPSRDTSPFESYGVLGALLAQASAAGWTDRTFSSAVFRWSGDVDLATNDATLGKALADALGFEETRRTTDPVKPLFDGDSPEVWNCIYWKGSYAGHQVEIRAGWSSPVDGAPEVRA